MCFKGNYHLWQKASSQLWLTSSRLFQNSQSIFKLFQILRVLVLAANNVYTSPPPSNSSSNGGSSSTPSAHLVPVVNDRASSFSMSYYTSSMWATSELSEVSVNHWLNQFCISNFFCLWICYGELNSGAQFQSGGASSSLTISQVISFPFLLLFFPWITLFFFSSPLHQFWLFLFFTNISRWVIFPG